MHVRNIFVKLFMEENSDFATHHWVKVWFLSINFIWSLESGDRVLAVWRKAFLSYYEILVRNLQEVSFPLLNWLTNASKVKQTLKSFGRMKSHESLPTWTFWCSPDKAGIIGLLCARGSGVPGILGFFCSSAEPKVLRVDMCGNKPCCRIIRPAQSF